MTSIKIITIGQLPFQLDSSKLKQFKSNLFSVQDEIEQLTLNRNSDHRDWTYSDVTLRDQVPKPNNDGILFAIVNVPIEDNYFTRRLEDNVVVFTFHEIREILSQENIPLENIILRLLFVYSLIFKQNGNLLPPMSDIKNYMHDEARGCLFDMCGIKSEICYSCVSPKICNECAGNLNNNRISLDVVNKTKAELRKIRKPLFYRIYDFVKEHPILSLIFSALSAIFLGSLGSLIANWLYEYFKNSA